jgi:hypothetical protein
MLAAHRNNPFTSLASNCLSGAIFHLFPFLRVAPQKDRAGSHLLTASRMQSFTPDSLPSLYVSASLADTACLKSWFPPRRRSWQSFPLPPLFVPLRFRFGRWTAPAKGSGRNRTCYACGDFAFRCPVVLRPRHHGPFIACVSLSTPPILARFLGSWCHAPILIPLALRSLVSQPFGA